MVISTNINHLEDQIDIMVYKLYNLTYEEVKIIDPEIDKIISEKDYLSGTAFSEDE